MAAGEGRARPATRDKPLTRVEEREMRERVTKAIPERACEGVCETEDGCGEVSLERREEHARVSESVEKYRRHTCGLWREWFS